MLEIRGMVGYGIPYTRYVGTPGPVITATMPDGVALLVSQGGPVTRYENCVLFFAHLSMNDLDRLFIVSWSFTGDVWVTVLEALPLTMVYDPPVNGLCYGLE
jgi:hypothetical protein